MRIYYDGSGRIVHISRGRARSRPLVEGVRCWDVPSDMDIPRGETHVILNDSGHPIGTTRWMKQIRAVSCPGAKTPDSRPKVAALSLLPPLHSGIADYTVQWANVLKNVWNITLFAPSDLGSFDPQEYDYVVAHIGNSEYHTEILRVAASTPCILLLHDADLSCLTPLVGREMLKAAVNKAEAVVAHTELALNQIDHTNKHIVPFVVGDPVLDHSWARQSLLKRLGLDSEVRLIVIAGGIAPQKNIIECIQAISQRDDLHLLIAGYGRHPYSDQAISCAQKVKNCTVWVDSEADDFLTVLSGADVLLHLRNPTVGEVSHVVMRALKQGTPVVVWDHGWYSSLPDSVSAKVSDWSSVQCAIDSALSKGRVVYSFGDPVQAYLNIQKTIQRRIALISPGHIGDILVLDSVVQGLRKKYQNASVSIIAPDCYRGVVYRDVEFVSCDSYICSGGFVHRGFESMPVVDQSRLDWLKDFHKVYNFRSPDAISFYESIPEAGLRRRYCWYVGVEDSNIPRVQLVPIQTKLTRPVLVVHPRGGAPHKCIPDQMLERLRDLPQYTTVVVGGKESSDLPANLNRAGELTLIGTSGWIKEADIVICVDSWVMHAALALGKPTISLWYSCGDKWYEPERVLHPTEITRRNHIILHDPDFGDVVSAIERLESFLGDSK